MPCQLGHPQPESLARGKHLKETMAWVGGVLHDLSSPLLGPGLIERPGLPRHLENLEILKIISRPGKAWKLGKIVKKAWKFSVSAWKI